MRIALVHPGDIDTVTGGYAYDRRILAAFGAAGLEAAPLRLDGAFPRPSPMEIEAALARLAATPAGTVLLCDGLAYGALPADGLRRVGRPIVALVHHPLALETGLDATAAARLLASERAALAVADAIIAISPETRRMLVERYAVAPECITLALPGTEPAPRVPADGDPPRLLAVGSLTPRKGYAVLLEALGGLGDLAFGLTIIGSADLDPDTARRITRMATEAPPGRVQLAGAVSPRTLAAAYAAADIVVHPALYEGYGMVLAEALRRGIPVVCTTGGAAAETVPDGAGLKVPPGDAAALAAALRSVIADPALRRRLADAAFAAGQALPTWRDTARIIAGVAQRVAA